MMSSNGCRRRFGQCVAAAALVATGHVVMAQASRTTPKFYPDDPLAADNDMLLDAAGFAEVELSEAWDFLINTFASPGGKTDMRAVNVNTLDEVPDSSWFKNRIGVRDVPLDEIVR